MNQNISKTDFMHGCQCEKMLWLYKHKNHVLEIKDDTARTKDGQEVGALARTYFPGAVVVPLQSAVLMSAETKRLIDEGNTVICEATFMAEGLSCAADIVLVGDAGLDVIEVKSSTSVKGDQLDDIAFQYHVITAAGYQIRSFKLMHLNGDYIRGEEGINVKELFSFEDVTPLIKNREASISAEIRHLQTICESDEEPATNLAIHCEKPHDCPARAYCYECEAVQEESVLNVSGMTAKKRYELYRSGIRTAAQLISSQYLSDKQLEQVKAWGDKSDDKIVFNRPRVVEFLESLRYPIYHLDFETMQNAVPRYPGAKPYMQMPFQYSLHVQEKALAIPSHEEFLAEAGVDPRRTLAEKLCMDIPMDVTSMAYNFSFEKMVCRYLAGLYPDLAKHLLNIVDNMVDLMVPFRSKWVYTKSMNGSYSIKKVLPALCGDDPSLDYHKLPVVHNGAEAAETFAYLHEVKDPIELQRIRNGMLSYCELDTLAMVKVLNRLYELAGLKIL